MSSGDDTALPPCKDFEVCGNVSDPRFTMDFTDVEPGAFIHWCAACGPTWHAVSDVLHEKIAEEPGFAKKLKEEIEKAERTQ